jgi:hypothetical protein
MEETQRIKSQENKVNILNRSFKRKFAGRHKLVLEILNILKQASSNKWFLHVRLDGIEVGHQNYIG